MADFKIESWEDDEKIITYDGKPIGCSLSPDEARAILRWAPGAFTEVFTMLSAAGKKP